VAYLELEYWKLSDGSHVENITIMHSMLGFVISLLLVFRTNTAYDRWWEGRKLWGSLVNNSRNLSIKLAVMLKEKEDKDIFKRLISADASVLVAGIENLLSYCQFPLRTSKFIPAGIDQIQGAGRIIERLSPQA
jgi:ion channel-forming bestrophin family protein